MEKTAPASGAGGPRDENPCNDNRRCRQMNKTQLVKRVAEKLDGIPSKLANRAVDAVFESIAEGLQEDGIVTIGKWGTYSAEDVQDE